MSIRDYSSSRDEMPAGHDVAVPLPGGVIGNKRLTAMTGVVLLVLLFFEGMTLLGIRFLFEMHVFLGFLLLPPLALKLASTGYRFVEYYTGNARYRESGPPHLIPRLLAPILVATTVALMATGIVLLLAGPQGGEVWRRLHLLSFILWFWVIAAHVLTYALRAFQLSWVDLFLNRGRSFVPGAMTRRSFVAGSMALGIVVAVVTIPWDAAWVQWLSFFHGG